jgi:hypothetical protein
MRLIMTFGLKWTVKAIYKDPKWLLGKFGRLSLMQAKARG